MKLKSLSDLERLLPESHTSSKQEHDGKLKTVRVCLETKGRKGKSVTLISDLQHNPATMEDIARVLKTHCGAGGTVKNGDIEIQGDHRDRVTSKLREMNYVVK